MEKNFDKTTQTQCSILPFCEPESTVTLIARLDKHECNYVLDPSDCQSKECPYSTGELLTQRWNSLERMYQLTKTIEAMTSTLFTQCYYFNFLVVCTEHTSVKHTYICSKELVGVP